MSLMTEEANNAVQIDDVLDTPQVEAPPREPDAHQGVVVSVERKDFDTGSVAIQVNLQSLNNGITDNLMIWPPKTFVENTGAFLDPATAADTIAALSTDPKPGKGKASSERARYSATISSTDGSADVQKLRTIAAGQGRTTAGKERPTNFDEFVALLNELTSGMEVVFTRNPDNKADDPRFKGKLRVSGIYGPETASDPKRFKRAHKAWETQG